MAATYTILDGAILELQYRYKMAEQQAINVFHYQYQQSSPLLINDTRMDEFMVSWYNLMGQNIRLRQTTEVTGIMMRAQWVYPQRYHYREKAPPITTGGEDPPAMTIGTSVVFQRTGILAARTDMGRIFVGGMPVNYASIGRIDALIRTGLQTDIADKFFLTIDSADAGVSLSPVIWSYRRAGFPVGIVSGYASDILRYQRRREIGRGE